MYPVSLITISPGSKLLSLPPAIKYSSVEFFKIKLVA